MSKYANLWRSLRRAGMALSLFLGVIVFAPYTIAFYQETAPSNDANGEAAPLADEQIGLAKQFGDLENLLLKLSEIEADTNPVRASILQRASKLGKESSLQSRLKEAGKALENKQFSRAIEEQEATKASLEELLTLLLSEDRDDRVREEKKKIEEMIKEIQRLNRLQKSLRQRTESAEDPKELSEDQKGLEQKAAELAEDLSDGNENPPGQDAEKPTAPSESDSDLDKPDDSPAAEDTAKPENTAKPEENANKPEENAKPDESAMPDNATPPENGAKSEDSKPSSDQPENEPKTDNMPAEPEKNEGDASQESNDKETQESDAAKPESAGKPESQPPSENADKPTKQDTQNPNEQPPSESGQPSEPQNSESESNEPSQPQNAQQPNQPKTPQQRVEQARKKMEEAQKKLEQAEKEKAVESQKQAEEELRKAVDDLEQILRQLREEEVERTLVQLETRFRRMLEMQLEVNEETKKLDRIAADERERAWEQRAVNLSQGERKIIGEAERALLLLREEGTSLAFPEAGEQLLADMLTVATRLDGSDVGPLTQTIESEIVTGLEEMLEALSSAQKDLEKKKSEDGSPPPPPQPGEPQQQPLVDKLAELRLIRTLQMRINTRTNKLAELMGTTEDAVGLTEQGEMRLQIRDLGTRQQRLQQITRDIVVGRSQ